MRAKMRTIHVEPVSLLATLTPMLVETGLEGNNLALVLRHLQSEEARMYFPPDRDRHEMEILIPTDLAGDAWADCETDYRRFCVPLRFTGITLDQGRGS